MANGYPVSLLDSLAAQWRMFERALERLEADLKAQRADLPQPLVEDDDVDRDEELQAQLANVLRMRGDITDPDPAADPDGLIPHLLFRARQLEVTQFATAEQRFQAVIDEFSASNQHPTDPNTEPSARLFKEEFDQPVRPTPTPAAPDPPPTGGFGPAAAGESFYLVVAREALDDLLRFIADQIDDLKITLSDLGPSLSLRGIRSGIEDIGAYPLLTSESPVGGWGGSNGGVATAPANGTGSLQRLVDGAIRNVLGRNPRVGDSRSFLASLTQSFEIGTANGTQTVTYRARSYSGQTELGGGVTGAQASLYARASLALDKGLPLLDGLYPLRPDADDEEMDAIRAIVRNELTEVVGELKTEGGPRVARVDGLLEQLFGAADFDGAITDAGGHFEQLADTFGFNRDLVVTLDEESNESNFIAVFDYALQIGSGWTDFRDTYQGTDLGTRLVLLSRALSVAAESVQEVYAAMDSVFVGPSERQVASFMPPGGSRPVLVGELLSWVTLFTTEEAPRLVQDGGRRGVEAIQPTAITLEKLVRQLITALPTDPGLPKGMSHARVRFPLQELRGYLDQIQRLAEDVRKPLRAKTK